MKNLFLLASFLLAGYANAQQSLPFYDSFSYPVGTDLHTQSPWTVLGLPAATDHIKCNGNQVILEAGGTDAQLNITSQNSGTVFYTFDLTVTGGLENALEADGGYVAGFTETASIHGGTLWIKKDPIDATNTKYFLGLEVLNDFGLNTTFTNLKYVSGVKYKIVVSYTFNNGSNNDIVKLWVNPSTTDENSPILTDSHAGIDLNSINSFFLRQDSTSETPAVTIDNLKISNTFTTVLTNDKFDEIKGLKISPNPASTILNITSNSFATKKIELIDVFGRVALKSDITNESLNISPLAKGVYIAKITEEGKIATRKIIIE